MEGERGPGDEAIDGEREGGRERERERLQGIENMETTRDTDRS